MAAVPTQELDTATRAKSPVVAGDADKGWFSDDSVTRRVFAHTGTRMIGAFREALMAAVGSDSAHAIETNSRYRTDPIGRAKRTLHFGASVVFGTTIEAEKAAAAVRGRHDRVQGTDPVTGRDYSLAGPLDSPGRERDRMLMIAGHTIIWESFMAAYDAFGEPLSHDEQDQYMREVEVIGIALGLRPGDAPTTINGVHEFYKQLAPQLAMSPHGTKLYVALTDPTVLTPALWPAKPAYSLLVAQTLTTIPECFRSLMPTPASRLDPLLRRSGRLTVAAMDLPPARAALDAAIHTDQAKRLYARGRAVQRLSSS